LNQADFGVAAHWRYKEGNRGDKNFDQKLAWLRQVLEWQRELKDANEFMESLKIDLFDDEVFVFTPKGDVVDLPLGSTPVDFAYQIHTDVGNRCMGARVNGKITPLTYQLRNGDIVEIITSKQTAGPSPDWLNFVKTSGAKHKIRQWFKKERREENIALGREDLEREVKRLGLEPHEILREERMAELAKKLSFLTVEDLVAAVGYGGVSAQQIVSRLSEEYRKEKKEQELANLVELKAETRPASEYGKPSQGIRVRGISNVLIRLARCCNPVPGDPIVGFITRGRGVSVHRIDCPNVNELAKERDRLIEVAWDEGQAGAYPVELEIQALDRPGLLSDVAGVVAESRTNIVSARVRTSRGQHSASIDLVLEIKDLKQLQYISSKIERVKDVTSVERVARETAR
ncbi:MAG: TGS domain-containing protein, partial [Firmicutes bacterium]|nr:TGS domain-containing protein [Bacillota bacterium]